MSVLIGGICAWCGESFWAMDVVQDHCSKECEWEDYKIGDCGDDEYCEEDDL